MTIRVLVVDDSAVMRDLLTRVIEQSSDIEVVGVAPDPHDARELIKLLDPDVLTLDVNMPRMNGIEMLTSVKADGKNAALPVIMLTTEGQPELVERAKKVGAKGWIVKPFKPNLLVAAVKKLTGT